MFFEKFREAAARLPAGLVRPGLAGDAQAIAAAERALGAPLPQDYASFLLSFDGADLFHESIVIAGVGRLSPLSLLEINRAAAPAAKAAKTETTAREVAFAESLAGDRFVFAPAGGAAARSERPVFRVRAGAEERVLAGSNFARWLDATIAREQVLYGPDGEFAPEIFDDDGEEIVPRIALRQAERALRADPGSAEAHFDRGVALRRLDRLADAGDAFESAGLIDTVNPWPWFDLGRTVLPLDPRRALAAFRRAADAEAQAKPHGDAPADTDADAGDEQESDDGGRAASARMLAWAAHAALAARDPAAAGEARAAALARRPGLVDDLRRAVAAALDDGDSEAARQASLLVEAIEPVPARRRLPLLDEAGPAAKAALGDHATTRTTNQTTTPPTNPTTIRAPKPASAPRPAKPRAAEPRPAPKRAGKPHLGPPGEGGAATRSPSRPARPPQPGRRRRPERAAPPPRGGSPRGPRR